MVFGFKAQSQMTPLTTDCNTWLNINGIGGGVQIGDLDIQGNQITVEALITRTALPLDTTSHGQGDIVSKQSDPNDANYLLRADRAEITTTNGYFRTNPVCEFKSEKTYHVAMVYDGAKLKFYRNGFLLSEVACTGNMITNDWITTIGEYAWQPGYYGTALIGYINEVRIWDIARTQEELRSFLNNPLPAPTSASGLRAYYQFDNLQNKQGNIKWNGMLIGNASINSTNPYCSFVQDSCNIICDKKVDFGFRQSLCNPSTVEFVHNNSGVQNMLWNFGSFGSSDSFTPSLFVENIDQDIPVMLSVTDINGCQSQVVKTIRAGYIQQKQLDTTVCKGSEIILRAPQSHTYCWTLADDITGVRSQDQRILAEISRTYYYKRMELGENRIINGNFESGNLSFLSEYNYSPDGKIPGNYTIGSIPKVWNDQITCDVPSSVSKMLLLNGENITGTTIWSSKVNIAANTNYLFEYNIANLKSGNPRIHIYINGSKIDQYEYGNAPLCEWQQYQLIWNSGNLTEVEIKLVTGLLPTGNNVFALDNILLSEYKLFSEYINLNVVSPPTIAASEDDEICIGMEKTLLVETDDPSTVTWYPNTNMDNYTSSSPKVSPVQTTTYYVSAESISGCTAEDSVTITVIPKPVFSINAPEMEICYATETTLTALGGTSYQWFHELNYLGDSPELKLDGTLDGLFSVIINDEKCNITDTMTSTVSLLPVPEITIIKSNDIDCKQSIATLQVSGSNQLEWFPDNSIIEKGNNYIKVAPGKQTTYYVKAFDPNGCFVTDSILVSFNAINSGEGIKIPNAFSPNGDNKNDCFGASKFGFISGYQLRIWNRWGQQVFMSKSPADCWNGTFNGVKQPIGTYVYHLIGNSVCGNVNEKGTIELIR